MNIKRIVPCLACVAVLSACATGNPVIEKHPINTDMALAEADAAAKAGQGDKAVQLLRAAASADPANKSPWLQLAQMRFDTGNYGEAIVNALEGLQRDPDDKLGHSIVAVSGLRLTSKALTDLSQKNNLTGSIRTEAQDLAKLLRTSLGEEVLVPTVATKPPPHPLVKRQVSIPAKARPSNDPFTGLK